MAGSRPRAPIAAAGRARSWLPGRRLLIRVLAGVVAAMLLALVVIGLVVPAVTDPSYEPRVLIAGGPNAHRVVVVAAEGSQHRSFLRGATLAVDEVNAEGGIGGAPLELVHVSEESYTEDALLEDVVARTLKLAARVSDEDRLLAVLGHGWSATAVPASALYANENVLYFSTHATASSLTNHGFDTVFGLLPNNSDNAAMMAHYALAEGLENVVILSDKSNYALETASLFGTWLTRKGGTVLYRGYVNSHLRTLDRLMMFILDNPLFTVEEVDAMFVVSSSTKDTARLIRRARDLNLEMPILGADYIFNSTIEDNVGKAAMKNVAGVSLYDLEGETPEARAFTAAYRDSFGVAPDLMAAVGYDAVYLLRHAVRGAGSTVPITVADFLRVSRYEAPFTGATGRLVFDAQGLVTDTHAFIVRHDGTDFRTVQSYQKPLDWGAVTDAPAAQDGGKQ